MCQQLSVPSFPRVVGPVLRVVPCLAAALMLWSGTAQAATWFKASNNDVISSTSSWWTTAAGPTNPASLGTTNTMWFASGMGSARTLALGADLAVGALRVDNFSGTPNYSVILSAGNTLTINGNTEAGGETSGILLVSAAGGSLTINCDVTLGNTQRWVSSRALTVNGNVNLGANTLQFHSAGNTTTVSGTISGSGGITRVNNATGAVVISGTANTYGGVTTTGTGTLQVYRLADGGIASSIGSSANGAANLVLSGNTVLALGGNAGASSSDRLFTLAGNATINNTNSTAANSLSFTNSGAIEYGVSGTRQLTLGGANTGANTFAPRIDDNGGSAVSLLKADAGSWAITGSNGFSGGTTVSAGSLFAGNDAALGSGTVTLNGGGLSSDGAAARAFANNVVIGGAVTLGNTTNTGPLTFNGNVSFGGGARAVTMPSNVTVNGVVSNGSLNKLGAGVLTLTNSNVYTGYTAISQGTIRVTGTGVLGGASGSVVDAGNIWFTDTNANSALEFETAANLGPASQVRFRNTGGTAGTGGVLRYVGTTDQTVSKTLQCDTSIGIRLESDSVGGRIRFTGAFDAASRTLYLGGTGTGDNEVAGAFGGTAVTKRGVGTWVLSGTSTYAGATTLESGTLKVGKLANGGANSSIGSASGAANLVFSGGALTYTGTGDSTNRAFTVSAAPTINADGSGALSWSGAATYSSAGQPYLFTLGGANVGANTYSPVLADNGGGAISLRKAGAGRWVLSGSNTFTGTIAIVAGTLEVGSAGVLGGGSYAGGITNEGTLRFSTSANQALSGAITGGGGLEKSGAGRLTLTGSHSFSGPTTVDAGTFVVNGSLTTSAITMNGGTLAGSGTLGVVTVGDGARLAPGNSPGVLTFSNAAWEGGAFYDWEVLDATGAPGSGWDLFSGTGTLTVNATSGNKFTINLISLSGSTTPGVAQNFVSGSAYSWTIAKYASMSGFDASKFDIVSVNFQGGNGLFSLADSGTTLVLSYSPSTTFEYTGGTGDWSVPGNWSGGYVPSGTATLVFSGSGGTATNDLAGGTLPAIVKLSFSGSAGAYTLAGAGLAMQAAGIANDSAVVQTVGNAVTLTTASVVDGNTAALVLTGPVDNAGYDLVVTGSAGTTLSGIVSGAGGLSKLGSGTATLGAVNTYAGNTQISAGTLEIAGSGQLGSGSYAGTIAVNGTLSVATSADQVLSGTISGSGAVRKSGAGTLTLTGSNSFSGGLAVSAGRVRVGAATAFGTGTLALDGGTLSSDGATARSFSNAVTIGGPVTFGDATDSGGLTFSGPVSLGSGTRTLTTASAVTMSGTVSSGSLTKAGPGTLTLSAANTVTGTTTITGGVVKLTNAGALGGRSGSIGTAMLIRSGTLDIAYTSSVNSYPSATLNFSLLQGNITLGGQAGATSGIITTSTAVNGNLPPGLGVGPGFGTTITYDATNDGGTATIASIWSAVGTSNAGSTTVTVGDSSATAVELDFTGRLSSAGQDDGRSMTIVKAGAGTMRISAANNFPGLTVSAGALIVNHAQALGASRTGDSGSSNLVTNNALVDLNGFSPTAGMIAGTTGTFTNSTGATTSTLTVGNGNNQTGSFSGVISDGAGVVAVAKAGTGSLTLSGSNAFSGGTTISAGTVVVGHTSALGTGAVAVNAGTLNLNGRSITVSMLSGSSGGTITSNTTGVATLTVNGAASSTFAGTIASGSGALGLAKSGAGALTLTGSNSFSGGVSLSGGALRIGNNAALGTGTVTLSGGVLSSDGGAARTLANALAITGSVTLGDATNTGLLTFNGPVGLGGATRQVTTPSDVTIAGAITNGGLVKDGTGRLTLSAANGYSGSTTVNTGTLALVAAGSIASTLAVDLSAAGATLDISAAAGDRSIGALSGAAGSSIRLNANTFTAGGAGSTTFAGVISGSGGFTKGGAGSLTLDAVQAFSGAAQVAEGALVLSGASNLLDAASRIDVLAGASIDATSDGLTIRDGQTLGGYGTVAGDLTFVAGSILSPGGSVGLLTGTAGTTVWNGGMQYVFEVNDADGAAGGPNGWDLFSTAGDLTLSASAEDQILLTIASLSGTATGPAADFIKTYNYAWRFAVASTPISSFDVNSFDVDASGFASQNGVTVGVDGLFFVARGDQITSENLPSYGGGTSSELYVVYFAIPEPGTLTLAGIGAAIAGLALRRRRRIRAV